MQQYLSKREESFCDNGGLVGVLISITCLIQHMIFMIPSWITIMIILVYLLCITGFVLLMKKQPFAAVLLVISAALILITEVFMMLSLAFSLVLVLLLVYLCAICTVLYVDEIVPQLRRRSVALKKDAAQWNEVI